MSSLCKKVLEALKYLPDTEIAEEYLREYQEGKALSQAGVELYVAVLDAIVSMLEWLDRDAYSKLTVPSFVKELMLILSYRKSHESACVPAALWQRHR